MILKFKKLDESAKLPTKAYAGDAGFDLYATSREEEGIGLWTYHTGLAVEIPYGYVGLLFPRSSIYKYDMQLANSVGVVDSGYRGEITFKFRETQLIPALYDVGDRIGQLVVVEIDNFEPQWVEELCPSLRGLNGYGSSGK